MGSSQSNANTQLYSVAIEDTVSTDTALSNDVSVNDTSSSAITTITDVVKPIPTRSLIRRNPKFKDELLRCLPSVNWKTSYDIFQSGVKRSLNRNCLGQRQINADSSYGDYEWLSYKQVDEIALAFGTSLHRRNLVEEKYFHDECYKGAQTMRPLGLFSKNCAEWYITEQAANAFGFTLVPLYDTLGDEAMKHIVNETSLSIIIVSVECFSKIDKVIHDMPTVKSIILLDISPWATAPTLPSIENPQRAEFIESFSGLLRKYATEISEQSALVADVKEKTAKIESINSPNNEEVSTAGEESPRQERPANSPTLDLPKVQQSTSRLSPSFGGESPSRLSPSRLSKLSLFGEASPSRHLSKALSKFSFAGGESPSRRLQPSIISEDEATRAYEELVEDLLPTPKASPTAAAMSPSAALARWQSFVQKEETSEPLSLNNLVPAEEPTPTAVRAYLWSDLVEEGERSPMEALDVDPDSCNTLCYTSGTTGLPKGVIISHRALVSNLSALLEGGFLGTPLEMGPEDVHQSYLPLAHIYERMMAQHIFVSGGSIGIFSGDTRKLFDDIKLLRPTCFISVPRIYSRLLDQIHSKIAKRGSAIQTLFQMGVDSKLQNFRKYGQTTSFYDRLIFNQFNEIVFGGRVRFLVCGAASFEPHLEEMMQILFCAPLLQGYGLTECIGAVTMKRMGDGTVGHVGGVLPWAEVCLESVPEMNCNALDEEHPRGEVLVRGPGLSNGYFRNQELTDEVFDKDGWFRTGDVGMWMLPSGALKIVDRKKSIFKLAQGEYVAPEKIENVYCQAPLIAQVFVYGHSDKDHLVGIIVPDHDATKLWAKRVQREFTTMQALIDDEELKQEIVNQMNEVAKEGGLKGFEKVKAFRLSLTPFSLENDLLTPTLKLKRVSARKIFNELIDEMYETA